MSGAAQPKMIVQEAVALRARAEEVFANHEKAERWWIEPNPALRGRSPAECARTREGAEDVAAILGRIEYGVLS